MTVVNIEFAATYKLSGDQLLGAKLEEPVTDTETDTYSFPLVGWALGKEVPAVEVEITQRMGLAKRVPLSINRPGVAAAHENPPQGDRAGFNTGISVLGLP